MFLHAVTLIFKLAAGVRVAWTRDVDVVDVTSAWF